MEAITREEKIMSGENLTPITRKEMFTAKLVGKEIETPSPITRIEKIMNGDKLTPITREEMFIARASGQEIKVPTPITRKEIFLNEISPKEPTYHTIRFLSEGIVLQESILAYGEVPVYFGEEPTKTDYKFVGWTPDIAPVTGDADYVAKFVAPSITRALLKKTITEYSSENVTKVNAYVFSYCSSLISVDLSNVTYIDNNAFRLCSNLESVKLPASPPGIYGTNSFYNINNNCVFYVPTGALASYQTATTWSNLTSAYSFVEEDR